MSQETNLINFSFEGKEIRIVLVNNMPYFVLKDLCQCLELEDAHKVANRLDEDERILIPVIDAVGRSQDTFVVNEPGLFAIAMSCKKPQAKPFKRWVTHEVLPSIRKTGSYTLPGSQNQGIAVSSADAALITDMAYKLDCINAKMDSIHQNHPEVRALSDFSKEELYLADILQHIIKVKVFNKRDPGEDLTVHRLENIYEVLKQMQFATKWDRKHYEYLLGSRGIKFDNNIGNKQCAMHICFSIDNTVLGIVINDFGVNYNDFIKLLKSVKGSTFVDRMTFADKSRSPAIAIPYSRFESLVMSRI